MTPDDAPQTPQRRPGRLRAALLALQGAPVVPDQIRAEWAAWSLELEGVCEKLTAAAARLYTRDQRALTKALKRVTELEADCGCQEGESAATPLSSPGWNPEKRRLNRLLLEGRGIRVPEFSTNGAADVDGAETEQG